MFKGFTRRDERAAEVHGKVLPRGHYPAEQVPDETCAEMLDFFATIDTSHQPTGNAGK